MNSKFEALHIVNKMAKMYESRDTDISEARRNALYRLKHSALENWFKESDKIEIHEIENKEYVCLYFDFWSFHVPKSEFCESLDISTCEKLVIEELETNIETHDAEFKPREALIYLKDNSGYNANQFIKTDAPDKSTWFYLVEPKAKTDCSYRLKR